MDTPVVDVELIPGGGHDDLVVTVGSHRARCDSYYLQLDPGFDPDETLADKARLVLGRLLDQWIEHVTAAAPGDVLHLPFGLFDQCTEWMRVTAGERKVTLEVGSSSSIEGYTVQATDISRFVRAVPDFWPEEGTQPLEVPRESLVEAIRAARQKLG